MATANKLVSVDFEIFGKVQGVFFRKYTEKEATKLNLVGWVFNTKKNTVTGHIEGPEENIKKMKGWLTKTGSPKSRIEKAVFTNEKIIQKVTFAEFSVKKEKKEPS